MTAQTLAKRITDLMLSKKAHNIVILNLKKLSSATDYFVVCSGDSDTHVKAIADAIRNGMEEFDEYVWHYEGYSVLRWVVLDYVDVVAHVFCKEERSFYNLERLWGDAKKTVVEDKVVEPKRTPKRKRPTVRRSVRKR